MNSRFSGQVVVVTGAASGIGAVIARHFADAGARLVLSDIDEERLRSVAESIAASAPNAFEHAAVSGSRMPVSSDHAALCTRRRVAW